VFTTPGFGISIAAVTPPLAAPEKAIFSGETV
jgi:hypothetical protein